ncbi:hypothetical protein SGUI_0577 [Serinicoccus hydrothermalis]|uniref:Uncharacterized protein n=1 Tax=Serinicoccus hydrothermalis TaxID=1758689 RepID=A0A1B1N953_9MICO|nr:hypothetical protein [Serinicoccus hydrothermalis]ANS77973.1 hypothetical protein SGUI_0577 [Serinicoccus hydrothermalis]
MPPPVRLVIGVYAVSTGPAAELEHAVNRRTGGPRCPLFEISHSVLGQRRAWRRMEQQLPVPLRMLRQDQVPRELVPVLRRSGLPVVLGASAPTAQEPECGSGSARPDDYQVLIGRTELFGLAGDVDAFAELLSWRLTGR